MVANMKRLNPIVFLFYVSAIFVCTFFGINTIIAVIKKQFTIQEEIFEKTLESSALNENAEKES